MKKGFSLIETLSSVLIFVIVFGTLITVIFSLYRINDYAFNQAIAINEARQGIQTLVREIRGARDGEDGSYPILKAGDRELIFHSDIDGDGKTERVRYFLGSINSSIIEDECLTIQEGGLCEFTFLDFFEGELISAKLKISIDGDFGREVEYADIHIGGNLLGKICENEDSCVDCASSWQGTSIFDITNEAKGNFIHLTIEASEEVKPICSFEGENYSMRVKVELIVEEEVEGGEQLRKTVTKAVSNQYSGEEKKSIITSHIVGDPPIFNYFNLNGEEIEENPSRLIETKSMKVFLVINVDPNRPPNDFQLESFVQIRNLK